VRIDLVVAADTVQVTVAELPELMEPVRQLDIGVAAQFGKRRGRLDGAKQRAIELGV
jgi:hypothetical protein